MTNRTTSQRLVVHGRQIEVVQRTKTFSWGTDQHRWWVTSLEPVAVIVLDDDKTERFELESATEEHES